MRINEIASAEDQMALWRLVSDSVWQAIETQRQQQAQAEQAKAAKAKLKPRGSRKGKSRSAAPMPSPPKKAQPPENPSTKPNPPPATNPQAQSPAQRQQALAPRMPVTTSAAPNALIAPKSGVFAPNTAAAAKPDPWSRQA